MQYIFYAKKKQKTTKKICYHKFETGWLSTTKTECYRNSEDCNQVLLYVNWYGNCQGLVTFDVSKFDIINNLQLTFPYIKNEISITVALSNK